VEAHRVLRLEAPTFSLDNRLTEGGKFVSLRHRPPFTSQEDSWYLFLLEAEPGRSTAERMRKIEKYNNLIGTP
jgi:hypothetical protein